MYRVIVATYTDPSSDANAFTGTVELTWGDGSTQTINRTSKTILLPQGTTQENIYIAQHLYSSDGVFQVSIIDRNRVGGILNINNGVNTDAVAFYVASVIRINNSIGNNQSPKLTVKPILDGCQNFFYMHNPGAYDPDGDSLVYSLGIPKDADGKPVPNYTIPTHSDSFSINPQTGNLYWVFPTESGLYNIVIRVTEYRNGKVVGYVDRDMQIRIRDCNNQPPSAATVVNSCVEAGDSVKFNISSTDVNIQRIYIRGYGGPFSLPISPAVLNPNPGIGVSVATTQFLWKTTCSHVRYRAHMGTIEAMDDYPGVPMASYSSFSIKVVGPRPNGLTLKQRGNGFFISWNKDSCLLANKYKIYRKTDSTQYTIEPCVTGMPAQLGYELIGTVSGNVNSLTDTFYYDDNKGEGLSPLITYCYRIVAQFPSRAADGSNIVSEPSESYVSAEACDAIILSKPVITKVSVRNTSLLNGSIQLNWIRPDTLDTSIYVAPYRLICKRAVVNANGTTGSYTSFKSFDYPAFYLINDTFTIDTNINTTEKTYSYRIEFQYDSLGSYVYIDESPKASSVFITIYSTDNTNILTWNEQVPWINEQYTIYKKNPVTSIFDSVTTIGTRQYADTGLINGVAYTYKIQSLGQYSFSNSFITNFSQEAIGIPVDTVKPCSPLLTVIPPCDIFYDFTNKLKWTPRTSCAEDVLSYNVYYKKFVTDPYTLLGTQSASTFDFNDSRDTLKYSIAGCYAVTGVDSFNNESLFDNEVCIDNCPYYEIPNVFTPEVTDGKNDLLRPFPYRFINKIELKIYNRWGQVVYETSDLDINWNGQINGTGGECPDGTYFYICDVHEQYLLDLKVNHKRGTIKLNR